MTYVVMALRKLDKNNEISLQEHGGRPYELAPELTGLKSRSRTTAKSQAFFFEMLRRMPTANAEDPRRSEGYF